MTPTDQETLAYEILKGAIQALREQNVTSEVMERNFYAAMRSLKVIGPDSKPFYVRTNERQLR